MFWGRLGGREAPDGGWGVTDGGWGVTDGGWGVADGGGFFFGGPATAFRRAAVTGWLAHLARQPHDSHRDQAWAHPGVRPLVAVGGRQPRSRALQGRPLFFWCSGSSGTTAGRSTVGCRRLTANRRRPSGRCATANRPLRMVNRLVAVAAGSSVAEWQVGTTSCFVLGPQPRPFFCEGRPLGTAHRQPPPTANRQQPPTTNNRLPPTTANRHQPPTTANRQPPTSVQSCFCSLRLVHVSTMKQRASL